MPSADRVAGSRMAAFAEQVGVDPTVLHRWSIDEPGRFWSAVWRHCGVAGDPGDVPLDAGDGSMLGARFFPGSRVSLAENLLADRAGATDVAVVALAEGAQRRELTWTALRQEVATLAVALRADGVQPGDRVAAWMPNVPETLIAMLAANAVGATFTSTSSDFGVAGVLDRFGQTEPVVLVAADGYRYGGKTFDCLDRLAGVVAGLPSLRRTIVVGHLADHPDLDGVPGAVAWPEYVAAHAGAPLECVRLPGDHPAYVLYSSGTTGKPKCIVHRALGIMLMHVKEQQLHADVRAGDRVFYFTTCGWMMWNWLVSALGSGATIVLYDGSPTHPGPDAMFRLAADERVTLLGVSAKLIDTSMKAALDLSDLDLSELRTVCSTGSPLSADGFEWVYRSVKADVHLASISGGTDLCGCLVGGDPTRPVYAGEIQGPALGMAIDIFDDDGRPMPRGAGELVCTRAFPSIPLGFWGDDGSRLRAAYFERFSGIWAQGDFGEWTEHGGLIIHGRSDATLNAGGVRIGTAELYSQVQAIPEIVEAVAVGQQHDGDTRIVLFVRLADETELDAALEAEIRRRLRTNLSPRHVPARIVAVRDVPRTRSGKVSELAVADTVNGRPVRNTDALANPDSLTEYRI